MEVRRVGGEEEKKEDGQKTRAPAQSAHLRATLAGGPVRVWAEAAQRGAGAGWEARPRGGRSRDRGGGRGRASAGQGRDGAGSARGEEGERSAVRGKEC
eukprot:2617213-Rhodomonas_salina.1